MSHVLWSPLHGLVWYLMIFRAQGMKKLQLGLVFSHLNEGLNDLSFQTLLGFLLKGAQIQLTGIVSKHTLCGCFRDGSEQTPTSARGRE